MSMIPELDTLETFEVLNASLTKALADKSVFKWSIPDDFNALFAALDKLSDDKHTLQVLAALGRTEAAVKKPLFDLDRAGALLSTAPSLAALKEGNDRYYAAQFIDRLSPDWIYSWAMENVWSEPGAEKARLVFVGIIFDRAANFQSMLGELGESGQVYVKANKLTESKVVALAVRVVRAIRAALLAKEAEFDTSVGRSIDGFIEALFSHFSSSQKKPNARENLIPEVVGLMLDLIGQRFSLAIESEQYLALKRMRKWCDDRAWREMSRNSPALEKLSNTIAEALQILVRQNVADGELLMRLKDSVDSDYKFSAHCQRLSEVGHMDDAMTFWLLSGGDHPQVKKTISSDGAVAEKGEAGDLGDLLLRLQEGGIAVDLAEAALDDLELFDPSLMPVIKDFANHWRMVSDIAEKMASKRSVKLVGSLGEKVEVDRKLFELAEEGDVQQRYGIVVRSAVVVSTKGKTQVIRKGIVKKRE